MDKKGTYLIAGIVIIAVAGFIAISFQKSTIDTKQSAGDTASTTAWENTPAEVVASPEIVITAKHAYQNGAHIVAGEIPLPSPCDILESNALPSSDKKQMLIQFAYTVRSGEKCSPDITPARFKVSAKADKNAVLSATLNGLPVTLNLIEAGPNENLNDLSPPKRKTRVAQAFEA